VCGKEDADCIDEKWYADGYQRFLGGNKVVKAVELFGVPYACV
jgi:hypothetical protein